MSGGTRGEEQGRAKPGTKRYPGGRRARDLVSARLQPFPQSCGTASRGPHTRGQSGAAGPSACTGTGVKKTHYEWETRPTDRIRANEDPSSTTELTSPRSSTPQDTVAAAHPGSQLPCTSTAQPEVILAPPPSDLSAVFTPITSMITADALLLRAAIGLTIAWPGLAGNRHVPASAPSCVDRIPAQLRLPSLWGR